MPTLSEADSKARLATLGVPVVEERLAADPQGAVAAADELGYPVVVKLNGERIAHKTERGLVHLNLAHPGDVYAAAERLLEAAGPDDGDVSLLVGRMVKGNRELIAGLVRDPQFGMAVMLGVGGILAEAVADVAFRLVPLDRVDAEELIDDLATQRLLGEFRGEPAVDREKLVDVLVGLAALADSDSSIQSADLNPLIVVAGEPVAVDALIEVA